MNKQDFYVYSLYEIDALSIEDKLAIREAYKNGEYAYDDIERWIGNFRGFDAIAELANCLSIIYEDEHSDEVVALYMHLNKVEELIFHTCDYKAKPLDNYIDCLEVKDNSSGETYWVMHADDVEGNLSAYLEDDFYSLCMCEFTKTVYKGYIDFDAKAKDIIYSGNVAEFFASYDGYEHEEGCFKIYRRE